MPVAVKPCRHGMMMFYLNDVYIGQALEKYGEYSEAEIELWKQFVKLGMRAFDVGANIGCFTLALAKMVGPQGQVFAIEPQQALFQMLNGNLALNDISNVHVLRACFGAKRGAIDIPVMDYSKAGNFGGVSAVPHDTVGITPMMVAKTEAVPLFRLDDLPVSRCDFIKIDVEGMENDVLQGAAATIKKHQPVLYVENDRQENSHDLIERLFQLDYRCWWHLPPFYNPANYNSCPQQDPFGSMVSINMLCAHRARIDHVNGLREVRTADDNAFDTWQNRINSLLRLRLQ